MQKKLLTLVLILIICTGCKKDDSPTDTKIKDGNGNIYTEIKVGNQTWLKEDLKTTKYNDGITIENSTISYTKSAPAYEDKGIYGFEYNFAAVETNKLCPIGYKVPTKSDFEELITFFGGEGITKDQIILKYVNTWFGKSNGSGDGANEGSGIYGTSTTYNLIKSYHMYYRTVEPVGIGVITSNVTSGHCIRCIKN